MVVAIGLRFMGGECPKLLADIFEMSIKSAERIIDKFLHAVDLSKHASLSISLPTNESDLQKNSIE